MTQLGALAGVTIVTPDLDRSVEAYTQSLGYRVLAGAATVGSELAAAWGTPQAAGCRMAQLGPASGEARFLRFVESPPAAGAGAPYVPLTTFGWNAVELVVQDLDALHAQLQGSTAFDVIGPPRVLDFDFTDQIRAMQVRGLAGEVLYLTEINAEIPGFELPEALSFVGCAFVAVLGVPRIEEADAWFTERLGRSALPPFHARVEVLAEAHGLPTSHRHRLSTIALPGRSLIEIDDFPASATVRPLAACGLPLAIAIASFFVEAEGAAAGPLPPTLLAGAAGELIELLSPRPA